MMWCVGTLTQFFLRCRTWSVPFGLSSRSLEEHEGTRNSYLILFDLRELRDVRVFAKRERLAYYTNMKRALHVWRKISAPSYLALALCGLPTQAAADVRIGVFGLFHPRELVVRPGDGTGLSLRSDRETCELRGRDEAHLVALRGSVQATCGGRTFGAPVLSVNALAGGIGAVNLGVPGKIARTFRGHVEVTLAGGELVPVVSMDLETAVASVVAAEQLDGTPLEALKAQAVATRSYFVAARGRHRGFEFCDTTHCQFLREPPAASRPAARAVRETAGLVLAFRGAPLAALYSASCGGHTRSLADAGFRGIDGYPYFAVECAYCVRHATEWERRLPIDADAERLDAARSEAARVTVGRSRGWSAVPGNNFDVVRDAGSLVLHGRGEGHGIGLCQAGAAALAREQHARFADILDHYYPGTTLTTAGR
jgi:stage II sporulation protein D